MKGNKMRLIDADKLLDYIDVGHLRSPTEICFSDLDVKNIVDKSPTVDAVKIVRCKNCCYYKTDTAYCQERHKGYCDFDNTIKPQKHYCAFGKDKGETNG